MRFSFQNLNLQLKIQRKYKPFVLLYNKEAGSKLDQPLFVILNS